MVTFFSFISEIYTEMKTGEYVWGPFVLKILSSIVVLIIGIILIAIFSFIVKQIVHKNRKLDENRKKTVVSVFHSIIKYIGYFIIGIDILTIFGVPVASIITVASVGSIAIGFGAQTMVKDFLAGLFILGEQQFSVGDIISINGVTGSVERLGIRTTIVRCFDGDLNIIPNGSITVLTNHTKEYKRAIINVGVSYDENIDRVLDVLKDEMHTVFANLTAVVEEPIVHGIASFDDSVVTIMISAKCVIGENYATEREIRRAIKNRFDKDGIDIPVPQRVVQIVNSKTD